MNVELIEQMREWAAEWSKEQPRKLPEEEIRLECQRLCAWLAEIECNRGRGGRVRGWKVKVIRDGLLYDFSIRYGLPIMTVGVQGRMAVELEPREE